MTDLNTITAALTASLLYRGAVERAERDVSITNAAYRAEPQARLDALLARWEEEAPMRAIRDEAKRIGIIKSQYKEGMWSQRVGGRWQNMTPEQAAQRILDARNG